MPKRTLLAKKLVCLWIEKTADHRESFGYVISVFLRKHPMIKTREDVQTILLKSRALAAEEVLKHPDDRSLHSSHKAFSSALDGFIDCLD